MNSPEPPTPISFENVNKVGQLNKNKKYELKLDEEIYSLTMNLYSNEKIQFNITKNSEFSLYNYTKSYDYSEITKKFLLPNEYYNNLSKVYKYFDTAISKNKLFLIKKNNNMKLLLKKAMDFDEVDCYIDLVEEKASNEGILSSLFNEIKLLKQKNDSNEEKIKGLIQENEEMKKNINIIKEENKAIKEDNIKLGKLLSSFREDYQKFVNDFNKGNRSENIIKNETQNLFKNEQELTPLQTKNPDENIIEEQTEQEKAVEKEEILGLTPDSIHIHELSKEIAKKACFFCNNKNKEKESFVCKKCNLILCEDCTGFICSDNKEKKIHEHPLIFKKRSLWYCDKCKSKNFSNITFNCGICDFDLCIKCYKIINSIELFRSKTLNKKI